MTSSTQTDHSKTSEHEFDHDHSVDEGSFWAKTETIVLYVAGFLYFLGLAIEFIAGPSLNFVVYGHSVLELTIADLVLLASLVVAGINTVPQGMRSVLSLSMSIEFLISLALVGALLLGKIVEAASLAFLYGVAESLEDYSMRQAQNSLKELLDLSPKQATVIKDGIERTVDVEEIKVGERVVVRPGKKISMDGVVVEGSSSVNEAPVTGESMLVQKEPGDEVFAGTYNEDGYLEVEVTKTAEDNTLARIIQMVQEAESTKAPSQQFVDRFAGYYTPIVVSMALIVGLIVPFLPGVTGGFATWWLRAMALLVIACPCGLLISTPVTVVSGISSAAGHGTLIKGGEPFEGLGQLDVICFDKTGTLSEGELSVGKIKPFNGAEVDDVLRVAASLESRSEHPIGRAISSRAREDDLVLEEVKDFQSLTAAGVSGVINGDKYFVGKPELVDVDVPEEFQEFERNGMTVVCVGRSDELLGIIGLSDRIRPEAKKVIADLHELGIKVVMITGDNERIAESVGHELAIDAVHSGLLPEEKVERIDRLREDHGAIAMVGDGINDAPALAKSDVGIAMGAAGSDTAIETADIALMGDNLDHVTYAVRLSRIGESIIKQNIASSIGVKLLLAIGVIPGFVNLITAVLIGDMGVTFGITGNAMRLRGVDHEG